MWTCTTFLLKALAVASLSVVDIEQRDAFTSCLDRSGSNDTILTPNRAGYNDSRLATINSRLTYWPAAIVYPDTPQDVQKFVKCAAKYGVAVVGRSGGHSYASYGVGGRNGSLVVDMSKMKAITLDASGTAKIQTGNRLGEIAQKLWDNGQRALPHGVCPYVGVGGHTSFGGFGPFSRVAGLLHDYVTEAEVVLADGTLTTASAKKNPDLFWALRGAGASYGIVTRWTFATLAAPPSVISYTLDYTLGTLTPAVAQDYMEKWQAIALPAPDNLSVICTIGGFGGNPYLQYRGTYYGTKSDFDALSSGWGNTLKPDNFTSEAHNWYDGLVALSGPLSTEQPQASVSFFTKSIFFKSAVTSTQWRNLFDYIAKEGLNAGYFWYIEVDRYGGGVAKQPPDATSFAHRDAAISFQLATGLTTDPLPPGGISFLNNMLAAVEPNPKAASKIKISPKHSAALWSTRSRGPKSPFTEPSQGVAFDRERREMWQFDASTARCGAFRGDVALDEIAQDRAPTVSSCIHAR